MFFRLYLIHRHLFFGILGVVNRYGKVYFSAVETGQVLGQPKILEWAEKVASCKLGDILSPEDQCDTLLTNEWVIEHDALLNLLAYRMTSGFKTVNEKRLYDLLHYDRIRYVSNIKGFTHVEACTEEDTEEEKKKKKNRLNRGYRSGGQKNCRRHNG